MSLPVIIFIEAIAIALGFSGVKLFQLGYRSANLVYVLLAIIIDIISFGIALTPLN